MSTTFRILEETPDSKTIEFSGFNNIVLNFDYINNDTLELYTYRQFYNLKDSSAVYKLNKSKVEELLHSLEDINYSGANRHEYKNEVRFSIKLDDTYKFGQYLTITKYIDSNYTDIFFSEEYYYYEKGRRNLSINESKLKQLCNLIRSAYKKMI